MKPVYSRIIWLLVIALLATNCLYAQQTDSILEAKEILRQQDSIEASINYQHGAVQIKDIATLNIPNGYKFIPADKTNMIISDIWGNPKSEDYLGMIVKSDYTVFGYGQWAFIISYDESGYVKDDDADDINYDDLLKEMKEGEKENNTERKANGYEAVYILGWAQKPYYDKENKVLHWAKKLQFEGNEEPTLNYDVRVLGRKGVLSFNAVGSMEQLSDVNAHIQDIVAMGKFNAGNEYKDFNPSIDKIAAYTIGGLIAGKLIAKTGLLILLLKNIKLILLAVFGGFAAFRKKIAGWFRKKKDADITPGEPVDPTAFLDAPVTTTDIQTEEKPKDTTL